MKSYKLIIRRFTEIEELLELEYRKLNEFRKEVVITSNLAVKFELQQRIERELLPSIRSHETEYAQMLAEQITPGSISEEVAQNLLTEFHQSIQQFNNIGDYGTSKDFTKLLQDILAKLEEPGKTASSKLKVVLPIIPAIVSYEIQADVGSALQQVWRHIKLFVRGQS